jgi:metal-responsive CopG/Arc/MetJ family transcriptional regulator
VATINFSVPEDVKREFNEAFKGENKSAVLTQLMRKAVEERRRQQRRAAAADALLNLRAQQVPVADAILQRAREQGRP